MGPAHCFGRDARRGPELQQGRLRGTQGSCRFVWRKKDGALKVSAVAFVIIIPFIIVITFPIINFILPVSTL